MSKKITTLILGNGADARRVRSALVDLVALDMVDRFLWADVEHPASSVDLVTNKEGLRSESLSLAGALKETDPESVLVVALEMGGDAAPAPANVRSYRDTVSQAFNGEVDTLHLFVPDPNALRPIEQFGWLTLVLSPEDAETPLAVRSKVEYPNGQHTASALATLAGLWTTSTVSPYVQAVRAHSLSGADSYARFVRTFHQFYDAAATENELFKAVFDIEGKLPQPMNGENRTARFANEPQAVDETADRFIESYKDRLVTPRTPPVDPQTTQVRGFAALKAFFSFFFRAVLGSPTSWAQNMVSSSQKTAAKGVQDLLYGRNSAVEVLVGNQSGKQLTSVSELNRASRSVAELIGDGGSKSSAIKEGESLSDFWRSYEKTTLALVDGSDAQTLGGGRDDGHQQRIVSDARLVVPSSDEAFDGDTPLLGQILGNQKPETHVQAYDPWGAEKYRRGIDAAAEQSRDTGIQKLRSDFASWRDRNSQSFAWRIGKKLTYAINAATQKFIDCCNDYERLSRELDDMQSNEEHARRLSKTLRAWTVTWFIVQLILIYLCICHYKPEASWTLNISFFTWQWTLFFSIVWAFIVLGIEVVIFGRGNQGIYEATERRRALNANLSNLASDMRTALSELDNATRAYPQFLAWSAILGRAINFPFGNPDTTAQASAAAESGLPANTVISSGANASLDVHGSAAMMRDEIFTSGWASEALKDIVAHAGTAVDRNYSDNGDTSSLHPLAAKNDILARIAEACTDGTVLSANERRSQKWAHALHLLPKSFASEAGMGSLRTAVDAIESGNRINEPFLSTTINPASVNSGVLDVDPAVRYVADNEGQDSLSKAFTVVEYGNFTDIHAFAPVENAGASTETTIHAMPSIPSTDNGVDASPFGSPQPPTVTPPSAAPKNPGEHAAPEPIDNPLDTPSGPQTPPGGNFGGLI